MKTTYGDFVTVEHTDKNDVVERPYLRKGTHISIWNGIKFFNIDANSDGNHEIVVKLATKAAKDLYKCLHEIFGDESTDE